jgi:hypothetical protein
LAEEPLSGSSRSRAGSGFIKNQVFSNVFRLDWIRYETVRLCVGKHRADIKQTIFRLDRFFLRRSIAGLWHELCRSEVSDAVKGLYLLELRFCPGQKVASRLFTPRQQSRQ